MKSLPDMVKAMLSELTLRQAYLGDEEIESIYFGGGTPSLISGQSLKSFLSTIRKLYNTADHCEITLEANPDDITIGKVNDWHALGINRLSLGIQSFHEDDLYFMNRAHTAHQAEEALTIILKSPFKRITADIIFGYQGLTDQKLKYNLHKVVTQPIDHLSCYALTVEDKTALHHQIKTGQVKPLSDGIIAHQFDLVKSVLRDNQFDHYEISNYARADEYAVHNTNYWKNKPYLGIGPSAHSYNGTTRQWNVTHNNQYIKAIESNSPYSQEEHLSSTDIYNEYIMTGLRTKWGVDLKHIQSFGQRYIDHFRQESRSLLESGQLLKSGETIHLDENAQAVCDSISSQLFLV